MEFNNFRALKRNKITLLVFTIILSMALVVGCSQKETTSGGGDAPENVRPVELNMGHFLPPMHPLNVQVLEPFAEEVAQRTDGRVKIFIYPANELTGAAENYDGTVTGVIDIGLSLPAYTPGRFPLTEILEFPFMFSSPEQSNLVAAELIKSHPAITENEYKDVEVLWYGTTDLGHILTSSPVNSLDDLQGMRLRSPSTIGNDVIEALGAVPVTMPVTEAYDAIERGIVDGTLLPVSTLISFRLSDVVQNVFEGNLYATPLHMVINKSSWNSISAGDQAIIKELLAEFPEKAGNLYEKETTAGFARAQEAGIPVYTPTEEDMQKFRETVEPLVEEWLSEMEAKGLPAREVYDLVRSLAEKYE